jgi:hypothetical protein
MYTAAGQLSSVEYRKGLDPTRYQSVDLPEDPWWRDLIPKPAGRHRKRPEAEAFLLAGMRGPGRPTVPGA